MKSSGIGGQAVIEGIMMRNKDKYSIAVRKPDNDIEVTVRDCKVLTEKYKWMGYLYIFIILLSLYKMLFYIYNTTTTYKILLFL
mgnify:CR=1 FL=1